MKSRARLRHWLGTAPLRAKFAAHVAYLTKPLDVGVFLRTVDAQLGLEPEQRA